MNKTNRILIILFSLFFCISVNELKAQLSYRVLFLGNSYTAVNNLPQLIHDVALSAGDTLIFDSYAPGGYQLEDHSIDPTSQGKIMASGWDYVVMQGQSQEPVVSNNQFTTGGGALFSLVRQYNSCAVPMPYMTWGRKNGDASTCPSFPVMCTYESMDSALRVKYLEMASWFQGEISPVSVVWNYLRHNNPGIELYQADESHPSLAGSYAAACCFYAALFKKDPTLITFDPGLSAGDASLIRYAAKTQVFDSLQLWDFKKLPIAKIQYQIGTGVNEVFFHAVSPGVGQNYLWDFGDGDTSTSVVAMHSYVSDGTYTVSLTTTNCNLQGTHTSFADTVIQFCSHTPTIYTSNPWVCKYDTLWTQPADSYQWYYGTALPENNQYLANYYQYNVSGFTVMSTVNGCSELSQQYSETPVWSGYYFDGIGDPCDGDTVAFAVLNTSGSLTGLENILWYKNDTLLPLMTDEDTLLITGSGKYECKIIEPNSNCPLDTTYASLEYTCGVVGMEQRDKELSWVIFPNPASETITIKFTGNHTKEQVEIYSAIGRLAKVMEISGTATEINIADLSNGLYYIKLKNNKQPPLKFIKL